MRVKNLSSAQLAEIIGVQRSGISHILSGRNKPSLDFVVKVLEAYPDLNESWLLKGEGEMLKSPTNSLFMQENDIVSEEIEEKIVEEDTIKQVIEVEATYSGIEAEPFVPEVVAGDELKQKASMEDNLSSLLQKKLSKIPHTITKGQHSVKDKTLVKLIEIYSDDSFKVYYTE